MISLCSGLRNTMKSYFCSGFFFSVWKTTQQKCDYVVKVYNKIWILLLIYFHAQQHNGITIPLCFCPRANFGINQKSIHVGSTNGKNGSANRNSSDLTFFKLTNHHNYMVIKTFKKMIIKINLQVNLRKHIKLVKNPPNLTFFKFNHRPLLLNMNPSFCSSYGHNDFRFMANWVVDPSFWSIVQNAWCDSLPWNNVVFVL